MIYHINIIQTYKHMESTKHQSLTQPHKQEGPHYQQEITELGGLSVNSRTMVWSHILHQQHSKTNHRPKQIQHKDIQ